MRNFNDDLSKLDWVAYYKNHGTMWHDGDIHVKAVPVVVVPRMELAVKDGGGPAVKAPTLPGPKNTVSPAYPAPTLYPFGGATNYPPARSNYPIPLVRPIPGCEDNFVPCEDWTPAADPLVMCNQVANSYSATPGSGHFSIPAGYICQAQMPSCAYRRATAANATMPSCPVPTDTQRCKLTLEEIAKMAVHRISDDIIIRQIELTESSYQLSVDQIIWLKQRCVSDAVVKVLQERKPRYVAPPSPVSTIVPAAVSDVELPANTNQKRKRGTVDAAGAEGKVLILKDETTLEGAVRLESDRYIIRRDRDEITLSASAGLRLCQDWDDAYEFMKSRIKTDDAEARLKLAKWCRTNLLYEAAVDEIEAVLAANPADEEAKRLRHLFEVEFEQREEEAQRNPDNEIFRQAFGDDNAEQMRPIRLILRSKGLAVAVKKFEVDQDNRIKLTDFSAVIFRHTAKDGEFPDISTVRCETAYLTLDRPIASFSELYSRKIVAIELKGRDAVRITNNHRTREMNDDISIDIVGGSLFYSETDNRIWTNGFVSLLDGKSTPPTKIMGQGMEIQLAREESPTRSKAASKGEEVKGVDWLILKKNVEMHLYLDPQSGFLGDFQQSGDKRPSTTPGTSADKSHIIIKTDGSFRYNLTEDRAHFQCDKNSKANPDVDVFQEYTPARSPGQARDEILSKYDKISCGDLVLHFRRKSPASGSIWNLPGGEEIATAIATGKKVTVSMQTQNLDAEGVETTYRCASQTSGPQTDHQRKPNGGHQGWAQDHCSRTASRRRRQEGVRTANGSFWPRENRPLRQRQSKDAVSAPHRLEPGDVPFQGRQ